MLLSKKPIGTFAMIGGLFTVLEDFMWSFVQAVQYGNEFVCRPSQGEYIHLMRSQTSDRAGARNLLAHSFLGEWLLQTDTDHRFEPDMPARMLALFNAPHPETGERIDVLTGLYRYRSFPHLPVLYHFDPTTGHHAHIGDLDFTKPLVQVGCAGAGCLLVRRCVFDRIREELHEDPFAEMNPFSEDFSWFTRLRKLGIKVYVAPQIRSDHLLIKPVTDDMFDRSVCQFIPMPEGGQMVAEAPKAGQPAELGE
jgi:hypothetical protein